MKTNRYKLILVLSLILLSISCRNHNRFSIDTNKNRVNVTIHRFDKDLLTIDTLHFNEGIDSLYHRYPEFLPIFTSEVLDTNYRDTVAVRNLFHKFLTDTAFMAVNKKTLKTFDDISDIQKKVSDAFTYIHYYFPEVKLPDVYFYVSGFNRSIMMNSKMIGIGTDYYLGSDYPIYKSLTYSYMLENMQPKFLPTDLVSATLFRMFRMNSSEYRLLDNMLFRGKVLYLMSVFMPDELPEAIIGYSTEQLKWSKTNEKQIWGAIIDQKHLFSTDVMLIKKYMNDAPFTAPISQESPGRLGTWIGMQIVESYMRKNTNLTLRDLMNENNYQKMLELSDYRP